MSTHRSNPHVHGSVTLRRALRTRAARWSLALIASLAIAGQASAADTSYLEEMPGAERVLQEQRGTDAKDTAARQAAALLVLTRMMEVRIGRMNANLDLPSLAPAERQLFESYEQAAASVINPVRRTFDANCQGAKCESVQFNQRIDRYADSRDFQARIEGYFSAQWLAKYRRSQAAIEEQFNAQRRAMANGSAPTYGATQVGGGLLHGLYGFFTNNFGYFVVTGIVLLWLRGRSKRKANAAKSSRAYDKAMKKLADDTMARLGATADERFRGIEDLFDRKSDSISVDFEALGIGIKGYMVRSLAAMSARERETLRAIYHFYNIGELKPANFRAAQGALVWGDGKAQVFEANSNNFGEVIKNHSGMNVESAVSTVLHWLEQLVARLPNDKAIRLLKGRLLGGGSTALGETAAFTASQRAGNAAAALLLGDSEETGQLVTYGSEGSVITIAPPGSGKTQCHVFPTLLSWKGPAVVLDVKGEIYAGTSKWRSDNVGPVYKFAPLDPASSHCYNPLTAVRSDPDYLWEDSRFLADMMLVPSGSKDPFWENRARDILTAAIARACLTDDPAKRMLANVLDIFHGIGWDDFVRDLRLRVDIRSMARAGNSLNEMEPKTRDGVLQTALASLSAWDGDRIERATRKSDWSPLDLRGGKNPTIYICLKPNEVDSYISVLRVFIAQHIRMLTSSLPPPGASPILFVLDELPRLRQMPPVEEALEIGRQYGIRLWMFTQSLGQLETAYPNAEGMVGSCAMRMYMNPSLHDGTAQKISDDIGMREGVLDNSRQKIVEAPVLAGPDYKDFVIVMATGFSPFRLRKHFAYQDATIRARMGSL
jgi:type IV secretion system protein VirD4